MTTPLPWNERLAGKNCVLCKPAINQNKNIIKVTDLSVATLYLDKTAHYKGYCQLVYNKGHLSGMESLNAEEFTLFAQDIKKSMDAIYKTVQPDHMNYAALGNMVPHLHYHLIPRYMDDPAWGTAIWAKEPPANTMTTAEATELAEKIRNNIAL